MSYNALLLLSSGGHRFEAENSILCTCTMIDDKC